MKIVIDRIRGIVCCICKPERFRNTTLAKGAKPWVGVPSVHKRKVFRAEWRNGSLESQAGSQNLSLVLFHLPNMNGHLSTPQARFSTDFPSCLYSYSTATASKDKITHVLSSAFSSSANPDEKLVCLSEGDFRNAFKIENLIPITTILRKIVSTWKPRNL